MPNNFKTLAMLGAILLGSMPAAYAQTFPDFNGQDEYVVTAENAEGLVIDTLFIPKGKTIRVAPDVKAISWTVKTLRVEANATIDLSAPQDKPARAADGGGPPKQAGYCSPGQTGSAGSAGAPGNPGVTLTINQLQDIQILGSLWIRTDSGPSGDGGNGGRGGTGGGHYSKWPDKSCGAGPGGAGGSGGAPGAQGPTSKVVFLKALDGTPYGFPNNEAAKCGRSTRPSSATGATGVIAIYGGKGCPGTAGSNGAQGSRG